MNLTIRQAADFLLERDNFLLVSHTGPDADTIGSASALVMGLRSIGKKAVAICDEDIPKKLQFLDMEDSFVKTEPVGIQTYLSIDAASASMLGAFTKKYTEERVFDLSIDHHMINNIPCDRLLLCADYSSCGEIIFELLRELGIKLYEPIAIALYAAISSDSGGFRFSSTRPVTMRYAAEIMETGIDFAKINRLLFETKSLSQMKIEKLAYNSIELYYEGKLAVVVLTPDTMRDISCDERDVDSINQIPRQIAGVEVSVVIRQKGDKVKVSLRSNDYFNVAEFASENFGGGGHYHAAGCSFDKDIDEVKSIVISSFEGKL
ncbi:MAG TPA: hypothetical protein DD733_04290 [Clostridiales bacterium]|nr:DHHA1 domain-containing protein [Eubacteriales bacterium]HBR31282.1 hypothetical protein [Clostridiales bacterium]